MTNKIIVANWKMNGNLLQSRQLLHDLYTLTQEIPSARDNIIICPPSTYATFVLGRLVELGWALGGQDCAAQTQGAYTGDISAAMLKDIGCSHVIIGHSERRQYHHEQHDLIAEKMNQAHMAGLTAILCIGETLAQYEAEQTLSVLQDQLASCLTGLDLKAKFMVAYEPIWSIGTGKIPNNDTIQNVHQHIKTCLYNIGCHHTVPILYGGSVNAANSATILALADVDGVLVGGASLKINEFSQIIRSRP